MKIVKKRNRVSLQYNRETPEVEWWDKPLLGDMVYSQLVEPLENASLEDQFSQIDALKM